MNLSAIIRTTQKNYTYIDVFEMDIGYIFMLLILFFYEIFKKNILTVGRYLYFTL